MSFRCDPIARWMLSLPGIFVSIALSWSAHAQTNHVLRVACDPNNLPFSNDRGEGFENKIAQILARDLNASLEYVWHAQRRGFFRETLKSGDCDLAFSAPEHFGPAATSRPYYRSTYVFITRKDRDLDIQSFDDPRLRALKLAVPLAGDVAGNPPPILALAKRNIFTNVIGFTVFGNYAQQNPQSGMVSAVARGEVDAAIAWGACAGYFVKSSPVALRIQPVSPELDHDLPMTFAICVAVKRTNQELVGRVNDVLQRRRWDIEKILTEFGVPQLPMSTASTAALEK